MAIVRAFAIAFVILVASCAGRGEIQKALDTYENGDPEIAVAQFRVLAARGDARAQFRLGEAYRTGYGASKDIARAVEWYRRAAGRQHAAAQRTLGDLHRDGKGVDRDRKVALEWYDRAAGNGDHQAVMSMAELHRRAGTSSSQLRARVAALRAAARNGDAEAQFRLGLMHREGVGTDLDPAAVVRLWKAAAQQGHGRASLFLDAEYRLAPARTIGGIRADKKEAATWLKLAAQAGDGAARIALASDFAKEGGLLARDGDRAIHWYRKAVKQGYFIALVYLAEFYRNSGAYGPAYKPIFDDVLGAALRGSPRAMYAIGALRLRGLGLEKDPEAAIRWWEAASRKGLTFASVELGKAYGSGTGVARDAAEADRWFRHAIERQNGNPRSIADLYREGREIPRNLKKAIEWYERAAAAGDARALYRLGSMYRAGEGVPVDYAKAFAFFTRAAAAGDVASHFYLGRMLLRGEGREADGRKAVDHFLKAADDGSRGMGGDRRALRTLGHIYREGVGVPVDIELAKKYYRRAAVLHDLDSMFFLAEIYLDVDGDATQAYRWWKAAAKAGAPGGPRYIGRLFLDGRLGGADNRINALAWFLVEAEMTDGKAENPRAQLLSQMTPPGIDKARAMAKALKVELGLK